MLDRLLVCAVLALPTIASAQVFKCVKGKAVSYQSEPCQPGRATEKEWESAAYAPPPRAELQRIRETEQATSRRDAQLRGHARPASGRSSARAGGPTGAVIGMSAGRCEEAKALRDRELYKLGPKRSIKQMRAWDGYVEKACKW